jgi:magnesium chelatase subunit D
MNRVSFPFAAIVGLPQVKLALMLGAVDWRLSVLLRGDKGAGKTTAARGIAELLPNAPFVNLPLGATEDRLLGGLDLSRTMKGAVLKPGLLAQSHGGVVYIDEVNLLPDHLADSLLDVSSGGVMFLEREGLSDSRECRFLLLGSMNPEEGELRPQLLDRFALVVDVHASDDPRERRRVVEQRLRFEENPETFLAEWASEQERLRTAAISARENITDVICPPDMLDWISQTVCEHTCDRFARIWRPFGRVSPRPLWTAAARYLKNMCKPCYRWSWPTGPGGLQRRHPRAAAFQQVIRRANESQPIQTRDLPPANEYSLREP